MEFKEFKKLHRAHMESMFGGANTLFVADVNGVNDNALWELYLYSFPEGTDPIFRERRGHDCSCCRQFIRAFGNVVTISEDGTRTSIWDFRAADKYQPVIDALSLRAKTAPIADVFVTKEKAFGTDKNHERIEGDLEGNSVRTWEHFYISLPERFVTKSSETVASIMAKCRDVKSVFLRSLEEISKDAIESVLDLIAQKSLYKGDEWRGALEKFLDLHNEYHSLAPCKWDAWAWSTSAKVGGAIGKIKNHSIGVLLSDITNGVDLNDAVLKYRKIVDPHNYKRAKAVYSKRQAEDAWKFVVERGLENSLGRRHAAIDDIAINNVIFANRDAHSTMVGDGVFDDLLRDAKPANYKFDKVEEISIKHFVANVLPRVTDVSVLIENRLVPNFVSLIAPTTIGSKPLFKWDNLFSWAYAGNIADSAMKQRVKAAGGDVGGILRYSIQWNAGEFNPNDFDAHCIEPGFSGRHIYFGNKGSRHPSTGMLDVDIIEPTRGRPAVENITWTHERNMPEGLYKLYVHNYNNNGGRTGFSAEVEFDGQIHSFEHGKELRQDESVVVAKVLLKDGQFEIVESLPSSLRPREIWGVQTGEFHPVSVAMFSPNYWDGQTGIGHKHYFFILANCANDSQPNGFFNEFLREEFLQHKRVFEALGSKMKVELSGSQLSGIGFSSTKRNSLVVKLEGHTSRVVRVVF